MRTAARKALELDPDLAEAHVLALALRQTLIGKLQSLTQLFVHRCERVESLVDLGLLERDLADEIFFARQIPMREELVLGDGFEQLFERALVFVAVLFHLGKMDVLVQLAMSDHGG